MNLNPRRPASVRGILQNFKQSPEHVEQWRKNRLRDIAVLRTVLESDIASAEVALKYKITPHLVTSVTTKMLNLLWFRSKDRKGLTKQPGRLTPKLKPYWLDQLNDNEEALRSLETPTKH